MLHNEEHQMQRTPKWPQNEKNKDSNAWTDNEMELMLKFRIKQIQQNPRAY